MTTRSLPPVLLAAVWLLMVGIIIVEAWVPPISTGSFFSSRRITCQTSVAPTTSVLAVSNEDNAKVTSSGGYKFGDLTRAIGRKVTGDENYQFGDISKRLDQRAKSDISKLTGKKEYKFGDLSRWADCQIKEKVANYTGNENYQVGDISKEVVRRVWAGEYDLEDVVLMIRLIMQMGASFTPIAQLLPIKLLLEILNVGLAQDVGSRVLGGVAKSLDERFKKAITGDSNYQLGDKTKQQLAKSLSKFTGKDSYSFGDITQAVTARTAEMDHGDGKRSTKASKVEKASSEALLELLNDEALQDWDRKLIEADTKPNPKST